MARSRLIALLLVPLAFMLMGSKAVLVDTDPVQVPAGVKLQDVAKDYQEENGVKYIHANYVKWAKNMQSDIQRELQLLTIK
jgi:hypothetical protein